MLEHMLAEGGQCRRLYRSIEQVLRTDRRLEILDTPGGRGLSQVQPRGGAIDRARLSGCDEGLNVLKIHNASA
ncbi:MULTISPECIES: hypothetical protein [unclassified Bosea (in: a-proteobacteria)]|uniref:hypothetical protein n=1 Tax=unclassified Bosea (in: a-proteobacteria) TaxID=2653178 RepID=UPI0020BE7A1F|nr:MULTISPECIES: hypothetical protein [unclassified Bosea (in: a-proteobacteria)]